MRHERNHKAAHTTTFDADIMRTIIATILAVFTASVLINLCNPPQINVDKLDKTIVADVAKPSTAAPVAPTAPVTATLNVDGRLGRLLEKLLTTNTYLIPGVNDAVIDPPRLRDAFQLVFATILEP